MKDRQRNRRPADARSGRETIYGRQPVLELLRAGRRTVYSATLKPDQQPSSELDEVASLLAQRRIDITVGDARQMDRLSGEGHHQGVVVVVSEYPYVELNQLIATLENCGHAPLLLVLDHIEDPQNLGSLLRSAEAAGVDGVIIPNRRAAAVTASAVRASAGAAEHLQIAMVANIVTTMEKLKKHGLWIAGLEACEGAVNYTHQDLKGPLALVVGSEGRGMARLVREHCDYLVSLPLHGRVGSLNAGVAGGIALYEILRQRASSLAYLRSLHTATP